MKNEKNEIVYQSILNAKKVNDNIPGAKSSGFPKEMMETMKPEKKSVGTDYSDKSSYVNDGSV